MTEITINTDVLVVGATSIGLKVAEEVKNLDYNVEVLKSPQDLKGLKGFAGDFTATLDSGEKKFGAIVTATDFITKPLFESYNLSPNDKIISQSDFEKLTESDSLNGTKSVVFLAGFGQEGNPLVMKRVFKSVLDLCELEDVNPYVFVNNLKVASKGLERLYKEGRDKGAIYFKLLEKPEISEDGSKLVYMDQVMRSEMELYPDLVVVEEEYVPCIDNTNLACDLNIKIAKDGLLQMDNVHRFPVDTARKGIFVAGTARRLMNEDDIATDSKVVALKIKEFLGNGTIEVPQNVAVIDGDKCAICLTCYRCCPHGAIYWQQDEAVVSALDCQACGNCASECPQDAIQLEDYKDSSINSEIEKCFADEKAPVVAFCCQNSAYEALSMASEFDFEIPESFKPIKVPCAGKVDADYILKAFSKGAAGVAVLACHPGNCKSEHGNTYAKWRVEDIKSKLEVIGVDKERVLFSTVASNMASALYGTVKDFVNKVK
ncbi:MAG: hydrogenase iron-sulfur subunit [Desulfobacterales bacterium]|nr:hydrogenase iron-sulfur subunit [Desulfobacterales bacterium]